METFSYRANWTEQKLKCEKCGETRSVKYLFRGESYCNRCVMQVVLWQNAQNKNVK